MPSLWVLAGTARHVDYDSWLIPARLTRVYAPIEPYESGMLAVGNGNEVYWEQAGNPDGKPAVVLHGGPGSGATPWWRRLFDPEAYRVVLFDQRGCGRSTPNAAHPAVDLTSNTTGHLVADIERLRLRLGVDRWLVLGGSWGSTLALAYAQAHPGSVSEIVLFSVTTTTRREVEWITRDVGRLFPEQWERFRDGVPPGARNGSLVDAYRRLLNEPDPAMRERAARDWCKWRTRTSRSGRARRRTPGTTIRRSGCASRGS